MFVPWWKSYDKHLLILWPQSPSAVILKPKKIKFVTPPIVSPLICHEVMDSDAMTLVFFPHSSFNKESTCSVGDLGSIPGAGRSPGEGNGNPLQYSCLENPMGRGAWKATVHGVTRVRQDLVLNTL